MAWAPQLALVVKNLAASAGDIETRVRSLGCKDPLERKRATHSSVLAWGVLWEEDPGGLQPTGLQRVGHIRSDYTHTYSHTHDGLVPSTSVHPDRPAPGPPKRGGFLPAGWREGAPALSCPGPRAAQWSLRDGCGPRAPVQGAPGLPGAAGVLGGLWGAGARAAGVHQA